VLNKDFMMGFDLTEGAGELAGAVAIETARTLHS